MENSETVVMKHLEKLAGQIGSRPLGSKRNHAAAEYIEHVWSVNGLDIQRQEIPCPIWENKETHLGLDGKRYVATANVFSPSCDIAARAVAAGTISELREADLTGRIAILYGELAAGGGYSAQGAYYFPERDDQVYHLLEEKRPAAVILVHAQIGSLQRLISDWNFSIPSVTVPAEVGLMLLRQLGETLHLRISSQRSASQFWNVLGLRAGTRRGRVVLCAHLDSMMDAPGAIDNGSGLAVLLTLAERLTNAPLPLGLEFIAFNGHENGGIGAAEYLRRRSSELGEITAAINVDGVGQVLGANSVAMFATSKPFQDQAEEIRKRYPGVVRVEPWYESDHTAFFTRGVPSLAFSSIGVTNVMHRSIDTLEWMSAAKLSEVVSIVTEIVESLQTRSLDWSREK